MADRPRPSPRPPEPDLEEPQTDPSLQAAFQRHDSKLTVRSIVIAAGSLATGLAAVLIFLDNRVAAQTDAGIRVHEARITAAEQTASSDRAQNNIRFQRIEDGQLRTDKKLDALLDRLNVANPAPTPKDAGR